MLLKLILLIFLLIIKTYNRTARFYTQCKSGAPSSGLITYSDCIKFAKEGAHCCLLYYVANPDIQINFYNTNNFNFKTTDKNNRKSRERKLNERENLCFGLTNDGYNEISNVIKELESESGIEEININCLGTNLNMFAFKLISLLILF